MKKKIGIILAVSSLLLALGGGAASAAYNPGSNINLNLTLAPDLLTTSSTTGDLTFNLQEDVHQSLTESTGVEVDHSYIMIGLNGSNILAVDPPAAIYNNRR